LQTSEFSAKESAYHKLHVLDLDDFLFLTVQLAINQIHFLIAYKK